MKTLSRGKAKVKTETLFCRYCAVFRKASARKQEKLGDLRYCRLKKKWVTMDNKGCKYFRPSKLFWCDEYGYWITLNECDNRRTPGTMFDRFEKLKCRNSCKRQKFQIDRVIRYA